MGGGGVGDLLGHLPGAGVEGGLRTTVETEVTEATAGEWAPVRTGPLLQVGDLLPGRHFPCLSPTRSQVIGRQVRMKAEQTTDHESKEPHNHRSSQQQAVHPRPSQHTPLCLEPLNSLYIPVPVRV